VEQLEDFYTWTVEDFQTIPDIGPVLANNLQEWLKKSQNRKLIEQLKSLGVNTLRKKEDLPAAASRELPLGGKTILFTGTLMHLTRSKAEEMAETAGAVIASSVSKKLDILVVGADAGSKLEKAQTLGTVDIIDENEFIKRTGKTLP
jgi:DNA ligase (NAD+)